MGKTKKQAPKKPVEEKTRGPIQITWALDELPSSQHKTGLVGLLLLVRWLEKKPARSKRGAIRVLSLNERSATLEFDADGLAWLFDEAYAAEEVEVERDKPYKDKAARRTVEREEIDPKKFDKRSGKPLKKLVTKYVYPQVVPVGAFLLELDPRGPDGAWIKLWRDLVWGVLRAVPKTRVPYEARAGKKPTADGEAAYDALSVTSDQPTKVAGYYFVGAQETTAENVPFRDRERFQFLLHFWPFAVGIGVPSVTNREGKSEFVGHALSFVDVIALDVFLKEFEQMLRDRTPETRAYLPRDVLIDIPSEGGLQFLNALRARLRFSESAKPVSDLVLGVDVFHVEREGNNVRLRSTFRIEPSDEVQNEYERIRKSFTDPVFRRQMLTNLLEGEHWTQGFDRLFATLPWSHFLRGRGSGDERSSFFPNDVKNQFQRFDSPRGSA